MIPFVFRRRARGWGRGGGGVGRTNAFECVQSWELIQHSACFADYLALHAVLNAVLFFFLRMCVCVCVCVFVCVCVCMCAYVRACVRV